MGDIILMFVDIVYFFKGEGRWTGDLCVLNFTLLNGVVILE